MIAGESLSRPKRGDELELEVSSLAFGGEGVARLGDGGYVVFVAGAVPGDRVRAVVSRRKRSYAHAYAVEVLRPSLERVAPLADHPGVPWQVLPYERQLEIKRAQVDDALRRLGGLEGFELEDTVPATAPWRYRNKLEYSFGMRADDDELVCGFHAPGGWKEVVPIEDCLLASERGNVAREIALRWCRAQGLRAWDRGRAVGESAERHARAAQSREDSGPRKFERTESLRRERTGPAPDGRARLRNLVVREGRRSSQLQIRLVTTDGELDAGSLALALRDALGVNLSGVFWTRSRSLAETTAGGDTELVWGAPTLPERLGELDLQISAEAFFQTNTEMAEVLYGVVSEYAALAGWERVYDLYCGIGTIALTLTPRAGELWGVELAQDAVDDAIAAASRNCVSGVNFLTGDVRLVLPELLKSAGRPDVVVVDPPRAGLSRKVVDRIITASPKRIVYVSCNPTTLAPNAAQLLEAGWNLRKVRPLDMFPQTHHIECVALLERS